MIKSVIWKIFNWLHKYIAKPRMICGYKNSNGDYLSHTRISNTTDIGSPNCLTIGDNVFISHYCFIDCSNNLTIGEGCQISSHNVLLTHSSHIALRLYGKHYIEHNGSKHIGYVSGTTVIGKYSFIGPHSVIMPNVIIGKGSIICAHSYVKSGIYPDFAILSGNPAQLVGDTRNMDRQFLENNPQLKKFYNEWANNNK
jgi:acetyltransferase-like isoleucine patch superfamily enzyme